MNIRIRPFQDADLPRFTRWLQQEHVRPWYQPAQDWLTEVAGRQGEYAFIHHFIILAEETPIGFCQHYPYWKSGETWHGSIPREGTYSIDYLIGEPEYLRRGCGARAIRLLLADAFAQPGARRVIVQPDEENLASRNVLKAAGLAFDAQNALFVLRREDLDATIAPPANGML